MKKLNSIKAIGFSLMMSAATLFGASDASAKGTIQILDVTYQLDTLAHFKVGPGTTTTWLKLYSESGSRLMAHYLTIDKSTPGVSIRAVCGTDKVAGTERVSSMAKRKTTGNTHYFAGSNADFFTTSGNATNGTSKVGSPTTSCTVDGEIYKTSNSQYQFSVDKEGVARIGRLNYYTGTARIGEKLTLFKGVNVASPDNGITIYTPKYWGSTNQNDKAGSCYEVTAKLVEGDKFEAGGAFRLEVTSLPGSEGDTKIPDDGFVIHGRGKSTTNCNTGAIDFVKDLKVGDIVEFDNVILFGNERIYPTQIVSGNPKNVGEGKTLDSEGERGDAKDKHPRTGIGVSKDGNTIIMMVVEGRYGNSDGVRTSQLADIMRYAGAYEAVNLDGGGSSTLYTSAFGVRNYCSDGNERAVGNGIFAVVEAPAEDKEIAEIKFSDWAPVLPQYANYTPKLLGFNKYGVLVTDSLTEYTLEVAPEAGNIVNDGKSFIPNNFGTYKLTAKYGSCTTDVAVKVDNSCQFSCRLQKVLINDKREYPIELIANNGVRDIPVDASVLDWSSEDASVCTVDEKGVVRGISDGTSKVTGVVDGKTVEIQVVVEIARVAKINVIENFVADNWNLTKSGCTSADTKLESAENGFTISYKVSSTRGTSAGAAPKADNSVYFWSLPDEIEFEAITDQPLKYILMVLNDNLGNRYEIKSDAVAAGEKYIGKIDLSKEANVNDLAVFPIKLTSLSFYINAKSGAFGKIEVPYINSVYADPAGVEDVIVSESESAGGKPVYYNIQGVRVNNPSAGLYIERKGSKSEKVIIR